MSNVVHIALATKFGQRIVRWEERPVKVSQRFRVDVMDLHKRLARAPSGEPWFMSLGDHGSCQGPPQSSENTCGLLMAKL